MTNAAFVGDSLIGQWGSPFDFPYILSARMGWTLTYLDSVAGSGWLNSATPFSTRTAALIAAAPDVVVIEGGINDWWATQAAMTDAASSLLATLRAGLPNATFYVLSPVYGGGPNSFATAAAGIRAGCGAGVVYLDSFTVRWITGTGNDAAPTGNGNADAYMASGNIHMTQAGHAYLGTRLAFAIRPPSTGLSY